MTRSKPGVFEKDESRVDRGWRKLQSRVATQQEIFG